METGGLPQSGETLVDTDRLIDELDILAHQIMSRIVELIRSEQ